MPLGSIINMQPAPSTPSFGAELGRGFGAGIAQTSEKMVNAKLNNLLAEKQLARQHDEWHKQGVAIASFEKDPSKRQKIIEAVTIMGQDSYFKLQDYLGEEGLNSMLSETAQSGQASKAPQARQSQATAYDYPAEGPMASGAQATGQNQPPIATGQQNKTPTIQQQEMLQATKAQAQNTELMANNVAPNIMGIPESQKQVGPQTGPTIRRGTATPGPQAPPLPGAEATNQPGREEGRYTAPQMSDAEFEKSLNASRATNKQKKERRAERRAEKHLVNEEINTQLKIENNERARETHQREMNVIPNKYIDSTTDRWQKNFKNMAELKSLEELSKKGDINTFKNRLITLSGWDTSLFTNPTEDIVQKVTNDLLPSGLSAYSGMGKVMQSEIGAMLKTFPTLVQTPEGRLAIIKLMYTNGEMINAEYDAMNQLRLQYQGKTKPEDFRGLVLAKAKPLMDAYQEKMHQILSPGSPTLESMKDKVSVKLPDGRIVQIDTVNLGTAIQKGASLQ